MSHQPVAERTKPMPPRLRPRAAPTTAPSACRRTIASAAERERRPDQVHADAAERAAGDRAREARRGCGSARRSRRRRGA